MRLGSLRIQATVAGLDDTDGVTCGIRYKNFQIEPVWKSLSKKRVRVSVWMFERSFEDEKGRHDCE